MKFPFAARFGVALTACALIAPLGFAVSPAAADDPSGPTRWTAAFANNTDAIPTAEGDVVTIAHDGGEDPPASGRLRLMVERGDLLLAVSTESAPDGGTVTVPDLQPGDVATLSDERSGAVIASVAYDGLPTYDATTCAGNSAFSGVRPGANATVEYTNSFTWAQGSFFDENGDEQFYWTQKNINAGSVTGLAGTTFSGAFDRPLVAGEIIVVISRRWATPHVRVAEETNRYVEECPASGPGPVKPDYPAATTPVTPSSPLAGTVAPPARKDATAPVATLTAPGVRKLNRLSIAKLRSPGLTFSVKSNEDGVINATLLVRLKKGRPTALVGTARVTAKAGVQTPVTIAVTKAMAASLRHLSSVARLIAHVTVTDAAGNVTTLADAKYKLRVG